jgi:hypothetical protein
MGQYRRSCSLMLRGKFSAANAVLSQNDTSCGNKEAVKWGGVAIVAVKLMMG